MDDFLQIGKTLRTMREERQLTVEDAAHQTCIPAKIIRALESDDYSVFSSATYARSYLSQYSCYLEIDPSPWLNSFDPAEFSHEYHDFSIIDEVDVRHASQPAHKPGGTRWVPSFLGIMIAAAVPYGGYRLIENFEVDEIVIDTDKTAPAPRVNAGVDKTSVASNNIVITGLVPGKEQALTDSTLTAPSRAIIIKEGEE